MGGSSCNWLKTIISSKGVRKDHISIQGKLLASNNLGPNSCSGSSSIPSKESNGIMSKKSGRTGSTLLTQDVAAVRIQTAFRRYKARKALKGLRTIRRCQGTIAAVTNDEKQALSTLKHVQFWTRMQGEIRTRRLGMVNAGMIQQKNKENRMKLEAKLQELEVEWCGSSETMEEILQRIQQREVAAVKRERAMAYAFSHQWRANSSQYFGQAYYDLGKDSWGWSWKERWIAVRPWECRVGPNQYSKKMHSRQVCKAGKTANPSAMRIIVTVKPSLPNRKEINQA
ncbi:OLC1v1023182C1 [Oldenlandia corymbosa var. corymbosa]|uniref:OLC1v1023182C1 n=1 Tax=Oldenlandia corymbosa var. corymbosa TaxID=529605 RepID=A0AAV1BZU9_OLDCO|nr:OLC1v1023182C1 [Oldenlandia corymbosa var. corymbosa]